MNTLEKYFLESNIITNKQSKEIGIKRHILASLVQKGELERVRNGVYKKKDAIDDDYATISLKNNQVVFSFHTALYLLGFSDRTPDVFHITVPQGYNAGHIKRRFPNIKVHYVKSDFFHLGIIKAKTPLGSTVQCYNMERCICDIVLKRKSIDKQIFINALTEYFKSKDKNTRNLIKYSRSLGIEEEIRKYMEVL
jgi:possible transcriptional regulator